MKTLYQTKCRSSQLSDVQAFYDTLQCEMRSLEALHISKIQFEMMLTPSIVERLHGEVKKNVIRTLGSTSYSLDQVMKAIKDEIFVLKRFSDTTNSIPKHDDLTSSLTAGAFTQRPGKGSKPPKKPPKPNDKKPKSQPPGGRVPTCAYCSQDHFSDNCTKITDIDKRWEFACAKKLCFNCLSTKHMTKECPSKKCCAKCPDKKSRHHTSLHKPVLKEQSLLTSESEVTQPDEQEGEEVVVEKVACVNAKVLLETALVTAVKGTKAEESHVLFDGGAHRTFIKSSLADKLNLKPIHQVKLRIAAFGARKSSKVKTFDVVTLKLRNRENELFDLAATVTPSITVPLKNKIECDCSGNCGCNFSHIKDLPLAHPQCDEEFDIDILIGKDQYWRFIEVEIIKGYPTAQKSKFGYVLSGPTAPDMDLDSEEDSNIFTMCNAFIDHFPEQEALNHFQDLESIGIKSDVKIQKSECSLKELCEKNSSL